MSYKNTPLIFLIIFLEGFAVLASEILMIRRFIPYIGNSIDSTATIIGLVLLPLALGYYYGGNKIDYHISIRNKLKRNITHAIFFLGLGFTLLINDFVFNLFKNLGLNKVIQTSLYMGIFFIYPIFLLAQTVPLVSNYFGRKKLSEIAGKILAFSTIGSLLGSFITSLVILNFFGVTIAVYFVLCILLIVLGIISRRTQFISFIATIIFILSIIAADTYYKKVNNIISDNLYSTIKIFEVDGGHSRILNVNNSNSAKFTDNPALRFDYMTYVEDSVVDNMNILKDPREILVVGSGGFTFGLYDDHNSYDYIDIDKTLEQISEEHLLKQELGPNKRSIVSPARLYLNSTDKKYDVILVDAFSNTDTIPFQLLSVEFFKQLKDHINKSGMIIFNIATMADFSDKFSVNIDNTLRSSFSNISRQIVSPYIYGEDKKSNIIYVYIERDYDNKIYSDDLNSADIDMNKKIN